MNDFKPHPQNFIIFKAKSMFEPNTFKCAIKINFTISIPFFLLIVNVKIQSNFEKEWCIFDKEN